MTDKHFEELNALNVNEHTEKKDGLTYLSWAWAWAEFKKRFPNATYEIKKFDDENCVQRPYMYDKNTGYMVMTSVTVDGLTHEMWLPVMDGKNKAMKSESYTYSTKYGDKTVESATMFDVNKTIMRCLVKNLAMFGLGLYIYAGEDLPEEDKPTKSDFEKNATNEKTAQTKAINKAIKEGTDLPKKPRSIDTLKNHYQQSLDALNKIKDIRELSNSQIDFVNNLCAELFERGLEAEYSNLKALHDSKANLNDGINF